MIDEQKTKPVATLKDGALKPTVWKNTNKEGKEYYQYVPTRVWKDTKDDWQEDAKFFGSDLLRVNALLLTAYQKLELEQ